LTQKLVLSRIFLPEQWC